MRRSIVVAAAVFGLLGLVGQIGSETPQAARAPAVALVRTSAAQASGPRWRVVYVGRIGKPNFFFDRLDPVLNDRGQVAFIRDGHAVLWQEGKLTRLDPEPRLRLNASYPTAINDRGAVVGLFYCGKCQFPPAAPWVWQDGSATLLDTGDNDQNSLVDPSINDRGQVVGMDGNLRAYLWQRGRVTRIGTLPGYPYSDAVALNDHGQVAGRSYKIFDNAYGYLVGPRAFSWARGKLTDLGVLPGDRYSAAEKLNERGEIIGRSYPRTAVVYEDESYTFDWEQGRPFVWQNGKIRAVPGRAPTLSDINDRGQIVGSTTTRTGSTHATLWQGRGLVDLGRLPNRPNSRAVAINDRGEVAGYSYRAQPDQEPTAIRGFVWRSGKLAELPPPRGRPDANMAILDINQRGQILGTVGSDIFLWTPAA